MGGRRGSRTQRKHFKQSRENVWKRPRTDSSADPQNPNSHKPAWQPFATQNPSFDEYYKVKYSFYMLFISSICEKYKCFIYLFFLGRNKGLFLPKNGMLSSKCLENHYLLLSELILRRFFFFTF